MTFTEETLMEKFIFLWVYCKINKLEAYLEPSQTSMAVFYEDK